MGCGASTQSAPVGEGEKPKPITKGDAPAGGEENGHHVIQGKIDAAKPKWAELNAKGTTPEPGMAFPVALVADQDEASAGVASPSARPVHARPRPTIVPAAFRQARAAGAPS